MAESRREFWRRHTNGYARSGLSQREYAARHGLNASTLSWWRWKLNSEAKLQQQQQQQQQTTPAFVPVHVAEVLEGGECGVEDGARLMPLRVTLPNGVLMDFEARCEPVELARYALALGGL